MAQPMTKTFALLLLSLLACSSAACGDDDDGDAASSAGSGGDPFGNATDPPGSSGRGGRGGGAGTGAGSGAGSADAGACDKSLRLVVRDFTEEHPDFEHFTGSGLDGIVEQDLGSDRKPVYAHAGGTMLTTGPDEFADWYRDVAGVNQRIEVAIQFMETSPGVYVYDDSDFFPIDGQGFGNGPNPDHNFLFTTEAHTRFTYEGGEQFTFRGDDDLWVFVNGKLAVDLGGLHTPLEESIDFDAEAGRLGITRGQTYPMDIFHAERHTVQSNFRIETTIDLSCIENIDVQ
jgi:fibro-slime domain-containing protein